MAWRRPEPSVEMERACERASVERALAFSFSLKLRWLELNVEGNKTRRKLTQTVGTVLSFVQNVLNLRRLAGTSLMTGRSILMDFRCARHVERRRSRYGI